MTLVLEKLRCDHIECRERRSDLSMEDALEEGWVFVKTEDGEWEYCSVDCLRESL